MCLFSLKQFADFYTRRDYEKSKKYIEKLWGDNFLDSNGKWTKKKKGEDSERGFCKLILDPIYKIFNFCMKHQPQEAIALAEKLKVELTVTDKELQQKQLFKVIHF